MISDEMLNKFIENPSDYGPTVIAMAKELIVYRKAFSEPVGKVYFDSYYGAQISLDKSTKLVDGELLYRKPTIPEQEI